MKKIWTPSDLNEEQLTPDGWDPDEWIHANSWSPEQEKTKVVKGVILRATYYQSEETIAVHLRKEDGQEAISYVPKAALRFQGKQASDLPKEETDRQMEKLAAKFGEARGRKINLEVYE